MYIYKRPKTSKSMMKTSLFLLAAAFMVGLVTLAADGGPRTATFTAEFDPQGNVTGVSGPTTKKLSANAINFPNTLLDLSFFCNGANGALDSADAAACFPFPNGITTGTLMVTKLERGPYPSGAWFWFRGYGTDGEEVTYLLVMAGTFHGEPWSLTRESGSTEIHLGSWEMGTEGNKNKTACIGDGLFPEETMVTVTWE